MNKKDAKQIILGSVGAALVVVCVVVINCKFFVKCDINHYDESADQIMEKELKDEQAEIWTQQKKILDKLKHIERKVSHGD